MALEGVTGISFLDNIDFGSIFTGVYRIIALVLLFLIVGGILFAILVLKGSKKKNNKEIFWFEEVSGLMVRSGLPDRACELNVPGTNVKVFFIKAKNLYLPRPTKAAGENRYWYCIRNNRELVNFVMKNLNKEMTEAGLDYDHTDMRYGQTQLKEIIKRNYRDKSVKWWKEYKEVITMVIYTFVITISFIFIASKMGSLIDQIGSLIEHADSLVKSAEAMKNSGIVSQ